MAQRVASGRPVRGSLLLRAMAYLALGQWWLQWWPRFVQPEEAWAGPVRAGHFVGDLRQRGVAPALVLEAVLEHQDGVGLAAPGAHQLGARLEAEHGMG